MKHKIDLKVFKYSNSMINQPQSHRLNEKFIVLMEQLADIMLNQGEPFRAKAYQKAQETIMSFQEDILTTEQLKGKPGIGPTIMEKLNEYVKTGTLDILEREKNNPVNILAEVYGIGPKKAQELVDNGITSIAQLRENPQMLNDTQKVGLRYYEDILKRIPRSEIEDYNKILSVDFNKVSTPKSRFEIVGSYRRGAKNSGDIDMIITSDTPIVFKNFIDVLIKKNIILEVLSRGPTKCLVIAKIASSNDARRVDFLYTSIEEYPFAVLYFTGSKIFNTVMRHQALQLGLTMNEHGLYKMDGKKKGDKVNNTFIDEKDIFDFLNMEYKTPTERIDGRALVIKKTSDKKKPMLIIENENESVYIANDFKKNGISVLNKLNEAQLSSLVEDANASYYNEEPFMTDNEFDIIKEYIAQKYPSNAAICEVGAPVNSTSRKVTLPYHMGSMDKIKPDTGALSSWMAKYRGPYLISGKLDGVSGLYTTEGATPKLYTRGDGTVGQDISHLIPHLHLPKNKGLVIRGEFIIPKATFQAKYKNKFANPRNMVAGQINHKTVNDSIEDIHFVAYELLRPVKKPSEQLALLSSIGMTVVHMYVPTITNDSLSQTLVQWRKCYDYEIDGVIVGNDAIYERKTGNPEHAFAFKMVLSDQIAEAKVVDVIWTPSKDGYLKPRVQIEPINLGGVRIEYATGFNGAFINDNKIGVGAVIELIRSGDVIPHIRKVVVPAEHAKMPAVPYKWNNTEVDIMLEDLHMNETVKEKNITCFFKGIGVEGLSSGNVSRIIQSGFDSVPLIIRMTVDDLQQVDGFKDKTSIKLYNGIREKLETASLLTIMSASNLFGRGFSEKRIELILDAYPNVLLSKETDTQKINKILEIKGMATKSAEAFVERIPEFIQFIKECSLVKKLAPVQKAGLTTTNPLFGKTIVMTGFRDSGLEEVFKKIGVKMGSTVSKNTFVVLVKAINEGLDTGKISDAKKLNIPIYQVDDFKEKFNL
jgi:DNA ligase (NAD+)